ncbi:family 20 glycosylhydrolase [Bifidobacterium bohemicum]|uniref:beta-N-acetylhexosaminidase n=1 Tax=Bifidobacterium bohemicum DSM 22767 TaxID=1437606 RepID=A0A086ZKA6_9BIFI|nr:family 20 glycosylhydrolase [Bifidobacterium bohemicum]KFI46956.1 glycoside hydrolase, family 20 [Bifidobacterium bohemicum DSM 22767]
MQYSIGAQKRHFDLIPAPSTAEFSGAAMHLPYAGTIVERDVECDPGCLFGAQLADDIERVTGIRWDVAKGQCWRSFIRIEIDGSLGAQAYRLGIAQTGISVRGGDSEGIRNGAQALRQIIRQCGPVLPVVLIGNKPEYKVRSYYLDVTRGRVPTMAWLKHWVDELCLYQYNQLQLYIEHSFRFDGLSETWRGVDALRSQQIVELDSYCAERGIELVPSVSTFGHLYQELRTRGLRDMGEFPQDADRMFSFIERQLHHTLNVTDPKAFEFSTSLMDSYMGLFRSKQFNIGADETFDLGKGRSAGYAKEHGVAQMYADYVTRLCNHLAEQGRRPMLWADIAIKMPRMLPSLPKDAMLLNWLYSPEVGEEEVRLLADAGLRQYVCAAVWCWNSLLPRVDDAWNNITRLARVGIKYGAAGFMVTDWGDYGHVNDPRMAMIGLAYGAQAGWHPSVPVERDEMDRMISHVVFGDETGGFVTAVADASRCRAFGWDEAVQYVELDDGHGGLNREVFDIVRTNNSGHAGMTGDALSVFQARKLMLAGKSERLSNVDECQKRLKQAGMCCQSALAAARGDRSGFMRTLAIALEGQLLLNRFGAAMALKTGAVQGGIGTNECAELAGELERWGEAYADAWRSVSQQSELGRVLSVIWRCADLLREDDPSL